MSTRQPRPETPFARVLKNYILAQRRYPPLNMSELARMINQSRLKVHGWIALNKFPDISTQIEVCEQLGIPLTDLEHAYDELAWPVPAGLRRLIQAQQQQSSQQPSTPRPRQQRGHRQAETRDEWTVYLDMTKAAMHDAGLSEHEITAVLTHLEQIRSGIDPMRQRYLEEQIVPATAAENTATPIEQRDTEPPASPARRTTAP